MRPALRASVWTASLSVAFCMAPLRVGVHRPRLPRCSHPVAKAVPLQPETSQPDIEEWRRAPQPPALALDTSAEPRSPPSPVVPPVSPPARSSTAATKKRRPRQRRQQPQQEQQLQQQRHQQQQQRKAPKQRSGGDVASRMARAMVVSTKAYAKPDTTAAKRGQGRGARGRGGGRGRRGRNGRGGSAVAKGRQAARDAVSKYVGGLEPQRLLLHAEEIQLARQLQRLKQLEGVYLELVARHGTRDDQVAEAEQGAGAAAQEIPSASEAILAEGGTLREAWAAAANLSVPELRDLLREGKQAREAIVGSNVRLVGSIVQQQKRSSGGQVDKGITEADLMQEGCIGLLDAAERFDVSVGVRFSTYATWWVRAAVRRALQEQTRVVRVPSRVHNTYSKIRRATEQLEKQSDAAVSDDQVSAELATNGVKLSPSRVRQVVQQVPASASCHRVPPRSLCPLPPTATASAIDPAHPAHPTHPPTSHCFPLSRSGRGLPPSTPRSTRTRARRVPTSSPTPPTRSRQMWCRRCSRRT
jgi:RNA polymerase sigma factor (sigma-70 family)